MAVCLSVCLGVSERPNHAAQSLEGRPLCHSLQAARNTVNGSNCCGVTRRIVL